MWENPKKFDLVMSGKKFSRGFPPKPTIFFTFMALYNRENSILLINILRLIPQCTILIEVIYYDANGITVDDELKV